MKSKSCLLQVSKGKVSDKLANFAGKHSAMQIKLEELNVGLMAVLPTGKCTLVLLTGGTL